MKWLVSIAIIKICTTGYMHGRLVANLILSEVDCFAHENNRQVHVQCGMVVIDSKSSAACVQVLVTLSLLKLL